MKVLVTGGAGFIGSHLVDALIKDGHRVTVFDNLEPIVHGPEKKPPAYLNKKAKFILGDLADKKAVFEAVKGQEIIFHLGGAVGLGLSMYKIAKFASANDVGTANLLEAILNNKKTIAKLITASSSAVYGEGVYQCGEHGLIYPQLRTLEQLEGHEWELKCPKCGKEMKPLAIPETKPLDPNSIYGLTKFDQEKMSLIVGKAYDIPTVALRFFGVYGPRQALSNPYAGVIAIFTSKILNDEPPLIYEDGLQKRDWIHVSDIVRANLLAMENPAADFEVFNVSSANALTLIEVVQILEKKLGSSIGMEIGGKFRLGDNRHAFANIGKIRQTLAFEPETEFEDGAEDIISWISSLDKAEIRAFLNRFKNQRKEASAKGVNI